MNSISKLTLISCITLAFTITTTLARGDLLIHGGTIHTLDETQMPTGVKAQAVYVKGNRIALVGDLETVKAATSGSDVQEINLNGNVMYPGFIEAHGHLMNLGRSRQILDLTRANSYEELISLVAAATADADPDQWIIGRGWHQSKWRPLPTLVKGFQTHGQLSEATPDNPVFLVHASGHAAFANQRAMTIAGITRDSTFPNEGEIIKDGMGEPTGIFNELAQSLIARHMPSESDEKREEALSIALRTLAESGITTFHDAGASSADIKLIEQFLGRDVLTARLWLMLDGSDDFLVDRWFEKGPAINRKNFLTVRSVKLYADGALGSRGAWLLAPYTDRANHSGAPVMSMDAIKDIAERAFRAGFQVGVHAIGDRANREVLDIFEAVQGGKNMGLRFRIEHAQHISAQDIPRFGKLGVIAAMQGIHMSSDRPWAVNRLGLERIKEGAYVWRKLIDSGAIIANGTDVPVEPINPIASYYALVTRQTLNGQPRGGYEPDQRLTRTEALRAYTLDAAYAGFEEQIKGSISQGKLADFTVLNQDLLTVPEDSLLETEVIMTIVDGRVVYSNSNTFNETR